MPRCLGSLLISLANIRVALKSLPGTNTLAYFPLQEEGFITLAPALLPFLEASSSLEPFLAAAEMAPGAAFRSWSRMPRFSGIKSIFGS